MLSFLMTIYSFVQVSISEKKVTLQSSLAPTLSLLYQVSQQVLDAKKFHEKKENSSKFVDFRAKREDLNSI